MPPPSSKQLTVLRHKARREGWQRPKPPGSQELPSISRRLVECSDASRHSPRKQSEMPTDAERIYLAEINIARAIHPLDDPRLADFVAQLDRVNTAADAAPGFVW